MRRNDLLLPARTRRSRQGRQTLDDADLVARALAFLEGFEAYPVPNHQFRLRGRGRNADHLNDVVRLSRPTSPAALCTKNANLPVGQVVSDGRHGLRDRNRPGRPVRGSKRTVQHAAIDRPPETHRVRGASPRIATRRGKLTKQCWAVNINGDGSQSPRSQDTKLAA